MASKSTGAQAEMQYPKNRLNKKTQGRDRNVFICVDLPENKRSTWTQIHNKGRDNWTQVKHKMGKHNSKQDRRRNVTFKIKQETLENSIKKLKASKKSS